MLNHYIRQSQAKQHPIIKEFYWNKQNIKRTHGDQTPSITSYLPHQVQLIPGDDQRPSRDAWDPDKSVEPLLWSRLGTFLEPVCGINKKGGGEGEEVDEILRWRGTKLKAKPSPESKTMIFSTLVNPHPKASYFQISSFSFLRVAFCIHLVHPMCLFLSHIPPHTHC